MGTDEEGTLAQLKALRKTLVDPTIAAHRGRISNTSGDGMLVEFASAVGAVRSAVRWRTNRVTGLGRRAREEEVSRRLMTGPGIGPISATAIVALAPPAETFAAPSVRSPI
ncbi:class 3 adenylate cyclase [Bradyrhizobium sp. F1.2.2]